MTIINVKYNEVEYKLNDDCALDESWEWDCVHLDYSIEEDQDWDGTHFNYVYCPNKECTGINEDWETELLIADLDNDYQ
jgi:hypothetical protein